MKKEFLCFLLLVVNGATAQKDSTRFHKPAADSAASFYAIPVFSTGGGDAESDLGEQDVSALLQSSKDLFTQFAGMQFGTAGYRMRGYAAENQVVLINGVSVNDAETGKGSWSSWGGLNDVTRFVETRFGNGANRYGSSGPGGYTNIDSRASSFKKGTRVSYALSSRIFRNRVMITHSTGLLKRGWALTLSASARWGNEVYVKGTFFNARSLYASLDKKLNDKHLLSFTAFTAPTEKGLSSSSVPEVTRLTNDRYYNSLWGYQNGVVRNSAVSHSGRPMVLFTHVYSPDEKKRLSSSIHCTSGRTSISGLNYSSAPNPKPDYYKYLPGYFYSLGDTAGAELAAYNWQYNINTRQVNWDQLIAMNRANLYSADAGVINTEETRARYIIENRIEEFVEPGFTLIYNERKGNVFLSLGMSGSLYKSRKYKELEDLLGASFWIDVDDFASALGADPMIRQNDISRPDREVRKGERFGYDYLVNINRAEQWAQAEYSLKRLEFYGSIGLSQRSIWRTGLIANGKFPESSKGQSERLHFLNYSFRGGYTYKISGRNFITGNLNIQTRAPEAANTFVSPRIRNAVVDDLKNEELVSADLNYLAKYPSFKFRFTLYSTQINNQTWLRTYFDESYNTLVTLVMTGVNQKHRGFELGLEKTIRTVHALQVVSGFAQSYYTNQPRLQAWQDNTNTSLYFNRRVYLENFKTGNSPQFVSAVGYRYQGKKFWSFGACVNYFDKIYVEVNPDRRTAEATAKFQQDEAALADAVIKQEQLPSYFIVNANVSKSFRLRRKQMLSLSASVNNLLNTQTPAGGYEQLRWDPQYLQRFDTKYTYISGTTYMILLNFSF